MLDGALYANGVPHASGGGSGGSIFVTTKSLEGEGIILAKGGDGTSTGGGGGGRVAVLHQADVKYWTGKARAYGGKGATGKAGGAGTAFMTAAVGFKADNVLIIDNNGDRAVVPVEIEDFDDLDGDSGRTWLLGTDTLEFTETYLLGGAHLAINPALKQTAAHVDLGTVHGDSTGSVHVGKDQLVLGQYHTIDAAGSLQHVDINAYIYPAGRLEMPDDWECHNVLIRVRGILGIKRSN